jgi:hypothetical protein
MMVRSREGVFNKEIAVMQSTFIRNNKIASVKSAVFAAVAVRVCGGESSQ